MKMLKITLECKNARIENVAELLSETTNGFKVWVHNSAVYCSINLKSLRELTALSKKLERIEGAESKCIKIQKAEKPWIQI